MRVKFSDGGVVEVEEHVDEVEDDLPVLQQVQRYEVAGQPWHAAPRIYDDQVTRGTVGEDGLADEGVEGTVGEFLYLLAAPHPVAVQTLTEASIQSIASRNRCAQQPSSL